jgi:hypothetical protein
MYISMWIKMLLRGSVYFRLTGMFIPLLSSDPTPVKHDFDCRVFCISGRDILHLEWGFFHSHDLEIGFTACVTGHQGMLHPPNHLICSMFAHLFLWLIFPAIISRMISVWFSWRFHETISKMIFWAQVAPDCTVLKLCYYWQMIENDHSEPSSLAISYCDCLITVLIVRLVVPKHVTLLIIYNFLKAKAIAKIFCQHLVYNYKSYFTKFCEIF